MDVDEILHAVKVLRLSWKWEQWNSCFGEVHKWNYTLFYLFLFILYTFLSKIR
jgi:hypothetical protein